MLFDFLYVLQRERVVRGDGSRIGHVRLARRLDACARCLQVMRIERWQTRDADCGEYNERRTSLGHSKSNSLRLLG